MKTRIQNYSLSGRFWSLISVVPIASTPTLYISHSGNMVNVTTASGTNDLNVVATLGNLIFRLTKP
jgi:hypothetical protein